MRTTAVAAGPVAPTVAQAASVQRHRVSEWTHTALFVLLCSWPYSMVSRPLSVGMLLLVSFVALLNRPLHLPKLSPLLVVFIGYCAIVIGLQTVSGSMDRYAVSQSNHIVQFALYYFAFAKIVQGCDWVRIITSKRFLVVAAILSAGYYWYYDRALAGGSERDVNITMLMLLLGLFIRGTRQAPIGHFLAMLAISGVMIFSSDRASVVLILAGILASYWLPMSRRATVIAVGVTLLLPIGYYLLIDSQTVLWLYKLDHNTGIRAEFIRGATSLLQQSPVFGVGFGGPYRPAYFPFLQPHPLLSEFESLRVVPNHHSLFDVALRLGIPAAALFGLGTFRVEAGAAWHRVTPLLCIIAAIGLSFNAVFENQYQLPQLVLVICLLQAGPGNVGLLKRRQHREIGGSQTDSAGNSQRRGLGALLMPSIGRGVR